MEPGYASARMPLPPFARGVIARQRAGVSDWHDVRLHIGIYAWRRARNSAPHGVCVPPGEDFREFDWSWLDGCHVTLVAWAVASGNVDALARQLILAGARLVFAVGHDGAGQRIAGTSYRPRAVP